MNIYELTIECVDKKKEIIHNWSGRKFAAIDFESALEKARKLLAKNERIESLERVDELDA